MKEPRIITQKQQWHNFSRFIIMTDYGEASAQLELFDTMQDYGATAFVYGVWTNPGLRRNGLGSMVIQKAEEIARMCHHEYIHLHFCKESTPLYVLNWYLHRGYDVVVCSEDGKKYIMRKKLTNNE